jgi:CheY-like chemotaxis protein
LIAESLQEAGYEVLEAEDGEAGLRILRSPAVISLLVTDVGLPGGMNGRQMADAARTSRPDLKVLFITGYAEGQVMAKAATEPGLRILSKPFPLQVLVSKVAEILAET